MLLVARQWLGGARAWRTSGGSLGRGCQPTVKLSQEVRRNCQIKIMFYLSGSIFCEMISPMEPLPQLCRVPGHRSKTEVVEERVRMPQIMRGPGCNMSGRKNS